MNSGEDTLMNGLTDMKPPHLKKWLSYLIELPVESAGSEDNPHLHVSLKRGRYQLSTAGAVYSFGDLYSNFFRAFEALDLERLPGDEVLVLGLGLGSIPLMLEQNFGKAFHFTAVEIDETVIDLACRYTLDELKAGIELVGADAHAFVLQCERKFDLVCMDVFLDDMVPPEFEDRLFLSALRRLLSPGGLLLYNRLAATPADQRRSRRFFEEDFLKVFPHGYLLDVKGNYMLLNDRVLLRET